MLLFFFFFTWGGFLLFVANVFFSFLNGILVKLQKSFFLTWNSQILWTTFLS